MSAGLERDTLFVALTRPQMFAGVTYSYFVTNAVIATELFLIFKSLWVLAAALVLHGVGMLLCLASRGSSTCGWRTCRNARAIKNYRIWGCNSYRP